MFNKKALSHTITETYLRENGRRVKKMAQVNFLDKIRGEYLGSGKMMNYNISDIIYECSILLLSDRSFFYFSLQGRIQIIKNILFHTHAIIICFSIQSLNIPII